MKRFFSLIKASMTDGMNIFKISTKKKNFFSSIILPILIVICLMMSMGSYSEWIISKLEPIHMEFVLLTLFIIITSFMTIIEGIYKSGNLLFNCKDDNLLLSLPISKSTVLFIRVFKFYVFELVFNSLFLLPSIIVYAIHTNPSFVYYIISFIGLLLFPIIPILISCLMGTIITFIASKFKVKNLVQTVMTVALLLAIMYFSYNSDELLTNLAKNASGINDFITKLYYPAGAYIDLIAKFDAIKLLEFIVIHVVLFIVSIALIGRIYFSINSSVKSIKVNKSNKNYRIKSNTPIRALIKKEFNRFINSPVFIINAGFGLVLFVIGCVLINIKYDGFMESIIKSGLSIDIEYVKNYNQVLFLGFICFTSFMTSITSSMISLEGKTFSILKSLPIEPYKIIKSKVLAAILIMIPCIIIGDLIVFAKLRFDLISIIFILIASVLLPLVSETLGILVNLKYPKMDAKDDTEVVKQSMSSSISVFVGILIIGITAFLLYKALSSGVSKNVIMLVFTLSYAIIYFILSLILHKTCDKSFDNIST